MQLILCAIHRIPFLNSREKLILHRMNLSEREFLSFSRERLCKIGLGSKKYRADYNPKAILEMAMKDCKWLENSGRFYLPLWDAEYPKLLSQIYNPPFALYVRSKNLSKGFFNNALHLAMVGTRKPSSQGIHEAYTIAQQLTSQGIRMVSGLARGIDSAAHTGTISQKGKTIAVLGHGCDIIYPRSHAQLAAEIVQNGGALLSEYPPGTKPLPFRFPQRNRIISGMSKGVILVEAPEKSGALITVDFALEEGREVLIVSTLLHSRRNEGGKILYEMGAKAVDSSKGIIEQIL